MKENIASDKGNYHEALAMKENIASHSEFLVTECTSLKEDNLHV